LATSAPAGSPVGPKVWQRESTPHNQKEGPPPLGHIATFGLSDKRVPLRRVVSTVCIYDSQFQLQTSSGLLAYIPPPCGFTPPERKFG
jgi:hypothetical protein